MRDIAWTNCQSDSKFETGNEGLRFQPLIAV